MQIIMCTIQDVPELAVMNKLLIEDEKSDNPMSLDELENRMREFILTDYHSYLFKENGAVIGYALIRHTSSPLYLRQFYIDKEYRRRHYGKKAFSELMDLLQADAIEIDVLPWNGAGLGFWRSLGFSETCISMKYKR